MQIKSPVFVSSSLSHKDCPSTLYPEFAFIGRSNVGKSSLINMLANRKKLAKISSRPGKTQLINHFLIDDNWYLVDLPGYGWAKVSKEKKRKWEKMIKDYLLERENLANVFLLIDSRHEPRSNDIEFIKWLGINHLPFAIVFTKCDKQSSSKLNRIIQKYKNTLLKDWAELPPIFISSIIDKRGKEEILQYISEILVDLKQ